MNFLKNQKKKITNVVKGKRNKDDDDDDFDNYVPAVPPHPSTLTNNGVSSAAPSENLFPLPSFTATFNSITLAADTAAKSLAGLTTAFKNSQEEENKPELTLDELKAKEEEHKRVEKEKLKQQEESKKDNEEWKYFLSLTAKVEAVTTKTQSSLTKLKDESAVKDLSKFEESAYIDKFDQSAPKVAGGWIAFGEQEFNPADPIFNPPPPEESKQEVQPVVDENTKKLARELIDDFGFTTVAPGIASVQIETLPEQDDIDPFDTSFIDVEAIKSGKVLKPTELIHDLDFTQRDLDPFDTSHVETAIAQNLVVDEHEEDVK